jgi:flavin-dependent dehydrogenase
VALTSETRFDLAIVGAGPAGSAAAITAALHGLRVLQLEAGSFPRHKVCGEFISAEAIDLLRSLLSPSDIPLLDAAVRMSEVHLHVDGKTARLPLRRPAISLSRAQLDLSLWRSAHAQGTSCEEKSRVKAIANDGGEFRLLTNDREFRARAVVNCSGRWSELTAPPGRPSSSDEKWIGLKGHFYEPDSPSTCDLYFFTSGYCGVLPLEARKDGMVNAAAMVRADRARNFEDLFRLQPALEQRMRWWRPVFPPVTTAPLLFRDPQTSCDGSLLAGDAAGFIDPFTGDGISLAIHGGIAAATAMNAYLRGQRTLQQAIDDYDWWYRSNLLPAFSTARRLRRLQEFPRFIRRLSLSLLNIPLLGSAAIGFTRVKGTSEMKFVRI